MAIIAPRCHRALLPIPDIEPQKKLPMAAFNPGSLLGSENHMSPVQRHVPALRWLRDSPAHMAPPIPPSRACPMTLVCGTI